MAPATGPGRIQLAGCTVQLAWLRESSTQAAPLFARARAEVGYAWCLCRRPALRLVIRCTPAGRCHVAGWPGEGEQHDSHCPFHKLGPGHFLRDRYSTQAIRETDDGVSIRLATALTSPLAKSEHHEQNRTRPATTCAAASASVGSYSQSLPITVSTPSRVDSPSAVSRRRVLGQPCDGTPVKATDSPPETRVVRRRNRLPNARAGNT